MKIQYILAKSNSLFFVGGYVKRQVGNFVIKATAIRYFHQEIVNIFKSYCFIKTNYLLPVLTMNIYLV